MGGGAEGGKAPPRVGGCSLCCLRVISPSHKDRDPLCSHLLLAHDSLYYCANDRVLLSKTRNSAPRGLSSRVPIAPAVLSLPQAHRPANLSLRAEEQGKESGQVCFIDVVVG